MSRRVALRTRRWALTAIALTSAVGACQRDTIRLTPEELEHIRLRRNDPDHDRGVASLVAEFGAQEGSGEVIALDPGRLTVLLRHRQASRDDWPDMVMTFRMRRSLFDRVKAGQPVYFRALVRDGTGEIVDIQPVGSP
jgi:Cu/Ag efflux protein CusF